MKRKPFGLTAIVSIIGFVLAVHGGDIARSGAPAQDSGSTVEWTHLSSADGDLPPPSNATQQTSALILDVDQDGMDDFVIGSRQAGPAMVWYQRNADGWTKHLIDDATLNIEAGGASWDIDGDGDLDVVMGGDYQSNRVWWWENPYPNYSSGTPWTRREIKNSGSNKHHDQIFGDFDGDGQVELVFWNQGDQKLFIANVPSDPKNTQPWPYQQIFWWSSGEFEGLAQADVNGDGKVDIVGGGRWFEHTGGTNYTPHVVDGSPAFARVAAGQLKAGGRPEVAFVIGDGVSRLKWYEWTGTEWVGHDLLGFDVDHGHSLEMADVDGDGHLDIFCAEMRLDGGNADAKTWVFLGDGDGHFTRTEVATGTGNHESKVGDLDGDGDLDILGKPYNWDTPRVDVWLNGGTGLSLDRWERHVVDSDKPWQSVFITSADVDGDGQPDIVTGGWWYQNPGEPGGSWTRHTIGSPLNNMAAVVDFDGDGDVDVLGTQGKGSESNPQFVWARNDGSGGFTILDNVEDGDGDFLQGVAVERFQESGSLEVALSWHTASTGVQRLTVPADPSSGTWTWDQMSPTSQGEALSAGDIDRDGDLDLLLGTKWLRNEGTSWSELTVDDASDDPDRNRLADINGDGQLDAVVGFEAVSTLGKLAWYEQGGSATSSTPTPTSTITPTTTPTSVPTTTATPTHTPTPIPTDTPTPQPGTILVADFDIDTDGFSFSDDTFRGTDQPTYASGEWIASGGFSGGALKVNLGGINDDDTLNMSGGWQRSFTLSAPTDVVLSFRYRLTQTPDYESDEYSQALVSVDSTLYGAGADDYVAQIVGDGNGGSEETTGWQLFEVDLGTLSAGDHTLTIGGFNNKKTYHDEATEVLIDDVVLTGDTPPPTPTHTPTPIPTDTPTPQPGTILDADFDIDTDGFSFSDDAFRGTHQPTYASGEWIASGGFSGGALKVDLGGINDDDILNMSGGWQRSFTLSAPTDVVLSFRYRLTQTPDYESDEYSQALLSVDSTLYGAGADDYVAQIVGDGNGGSEETTGWQLFEVNLGTLSAGDHTLTIGGYNNKKTYHDEATEVLIDDVRLQE